MKEKQALGNLISDREVGTRAAGDGSWASPDEIEGYKERKESGFPSSLLCRPRDVIVPWQQYWATTYKCPSLLLRLPLSYASCFPSHRRALWITQAGRKRHCNP